MARISYQEQEEQIDQAVAAFPEEFGLKAFPDSRFIIHRGSCLWDCGELEGQPHHEPGPLLYIYVLTANNPRYMRPSAPALAFCKATPAELRSQIRP